jgi:hypothetical protein
MSDMKYNCMCLRKLATTGQHEERRHIVHSGRRHRAKRVRWHHLGILTSNNLLNYIITNPQKNKMYKLTLRHVHATIVAVQINYDYVF